MSKSSQFDSSKFGEVPLAGPEGRKLTPEEEAQFFGPKGHIIPTASRYLKERGERLCKGCFLVKPLDDAHFYRRGVKFRGFCKPCVKVDCIKFQNKSFEALSYPADLPRADAAGRCLTPVEVSMGITARGGERHSLRAYLAGRGECLCRGCRVVKPAGPPHFCPDPANECRDCNRKRTQDKHRIVIETRINLILSVLQPLSFEKSGREVTAEEAAVGTGADGSFVQSFRAALLLKGVSVCPACRHIKPLSEFSHKSDRRCGPCLRLHKRKWRRERAAAKKKKKFQEGLQQLKKLANERNKEE